MSLASLSELFFAASDRPVCMDGDELIRLAQFRRRVAALAAHFTKTREARYALCIADPYDFSCAFFALLSTGKTPLIPAHDARGHIAGLADSIDIVLDRLPPCGDPEPAHGSPTLPADASFVMFTSGSSGTPKAVRKSLGEVDAELRALDSLWGARLADAVVLGCVPHHHFYGLIFQLLWPLAAGRAFDRARYTQPLELAARMRQLGAAAVIASPAHVARWPRMEGFDALSPVCLFCAGGPLAAHSAHEYAQRLGGSPDEIYGSTETGALAWRRQDRRGAWTALPGVELGRADDGALVVRSMHGARAETCHTQDAVRFDADGGFHLLGRTDRIVKIDDKRVSLTEMEARFAEHPFVRQAALVRLAGIERPSRERLGAVVELSEEGSRAWRGLGRHGMAKELTRHLSDYFAALPRRWRFRATLPYDARGKLTAAMLAREFAPSHDAPDIFAEVVIGERIEIDMRVPDELVHFAGHFPGMPILPGVVQVDWAIRHAARHVPRAGEVTSVERLKFMAPVRPGALLKLALEDAAAHSRVRFEYRLGDKACASGFIVYRGADA